MGLTLDKMSQDDCLFRFLISYFGKSDKIETNYIQTILICAKIM